MLALALTTLAITFCGCIDCLAMFLVGVACIGLVAFAVFAVIQGKKAE